MLKRNHRVIGQVVSETADGFTILQTAEHQFTAAKTTELLPATDKDIEFELRIAIAELVERARLFGVGMERLEVLLRQEAT